MRRRTVRRGSSKQLRGWQAEIARRYFRSHGFPAQELRNKVRSTLFQPISPVKTRIPLLVLALSPLVRAADKVTFDEHILPVFQQSCLNCHNPDKAKGGLDLSTYAGTLKGGSGGKIVEPGDAGSSLIGVIEHTREPKMPPQGDKLAAAQAKLLRDWIAGGLLENPNSSARKPAKPKLDTALKSDPGAKPDGPPPMPAHVLLEPVVATARGASVHALASSPWAPLLAVTGQRQVLLYDTAALELAGILPFPEGEPVSLAFAPGGRQLIVGGGVAGKSGTTVVFDVTNGSRLLTAGKEFDSVLAADIRPGFDLVATGGPSRLLKLWSVETGEPVKSIKKHTDWITALDISPDGVLLASGDRNGGVWVWESESGNEFHTLRAHQAGITGIAFRADSNILATASADGTVRYWEMNNGGEVRKNDAHPGGVTAFAFGRDGSSLTAGRDMKVKLWKPDFNPARDLAQNLPALPTAVALDFEGKRAFVGDVEGAIRVFDAADGKPLGELPSNPPTVAARLERLDAQLAELAKAQPPDPAKIDPLKAARKRWGAADILTKTLGAEAAIATSNQEADARFDGFSTAANALAASADRLNAKRSERRKLAALPQDKSSPETRAEIAATLSAIDSVIARLRDDHRRLESDVLKARTVVESTAPGLTQATTAAAKLRRDYLEAAK